MTDSKPAMSQMDPNAENEILTILALMWKHEITGVEAQSIAKSQIATLMWLMRQGTTPEEVRTLADMIEEDEFADDEDVTALRNAGITRIGCLMAADLMEQLPDMAVRAN